MVNFPYITWQRRIHGEISFMMPFYSELRITYIRKDIFIQSILQKETGDSPEDMGPTPSVPVLSTDMKPSTPTHGSKSKTKFLHGERMVP